MRERFGNIWADMLESARSMLQPFDPGRHSERSKALMAVGLVSVMWGTTWLVSARGVSGMPALQMSGIRHLIGGGIYIAYFLSRDFRWPKPAEWLRFTWMAVLMFVMSNGLSTWSVQYIPSGLGSVIGALSPIWIAIFSLFMFRGSRLNPTTSIGLLLGFGGVALIFSDYLGDIFQSRFYLGILFGMIAAMTWAIGTLLTVRHAERMDPYYSVGWQMFISGIILTVLAQLSGHHIPIAEIPAISWLAIAYLVVLGSMVTFAAFIYSLKRLPPAQASVYAYINPVVAVLIGAWLNGERLNVSIGIGTLVTLLGVYLVNTGFKKNVPDT
jgi:drug/metabolite transporter (DMT)-like permease